MTKVISLSDDAYELLKSLKEEGESFSDVVRKIAGKKKHISEFFGILKEDTKEWEEISKKIYEDRKRSKSKEVNF
ncbi:MAG: antitoxin VapB family protein [Candidatus Woesearchaeota archaeon]